MNKSTLVRCLQNHSNKKLKLTEAIIKKPITKGRKIKMNIKSYKHGYA